MTHIFEAKLMRNPVKTKSDCWEETAFHWVVTINGQSFDYYMGAAHVTKGNVHGQKAITPTLDDVLYALCSDASACDESFEDWCSNYGFDTDSRKALEMYLACQESATKLRKAGVNIAAERERLQDY